MALLLVFDRDNTHADADKDRLEFKAGDVIAVHEDTAPFGRKETVAPFRVVFMAGPRSAYTYLLEGEPATARDHYPRSMLQTRRLRLRLALEATRLSGRPKIRRQRSHKVNADNTISIKQREAR